MSEQVNVVNVAFVKNQTKCTDGCVRPSVCELLCCYTCEDPQRPPTPVYINTRPYDSTGLSSDLTLVFNHRKKKKLGYFDEHVIVCARLVKMNIFNELAV